MHWGWKLGLSLALAGAIVAYTAAVVSEESIWTLHSAGWLTAIIVVAVAMGRGDLLQSCEKEAPESDSRLRRQPIVQSRCPAVRYLMTAKETTAGYGSWTRPGSTF